MPEILGYIVYDLDDTFNIIYFILNKLYGLII